MIEASADFTAASRLPGLITLPALCLRPLLLQLDACLPFPFLGRHELPSDLAVLSQDALQFVLVLLLCAFELLVHLPVVCVMHELLYATLQVPLLLALVLEVLVLS